MGIIGGFGNGALTFATRYNSSVKVEDCHTRPFAVSLFFPDAPFYIFGKSCLPDGKRR
jgi:hypothetical protein